MHIVTALKDFTEREGYGAGLQAGGGYLVEQWLELMEVVLVDQSDIVTAFLESPGKLQAGKSCTEDDYSFRRHK
jgi:hypothetical protein